MDERKDDIDRLYEQYKHFAIQHRQEMGKNVHKTNKAFDTLTKIFRLLENDHSLAERLLTICLKDNDPAVKSWAAAHCLGLNIHIIESLTILEDISNMKGIGILSMEAEMTIKIWYQQGYIKFY